MPTENRMTPIQQVEDAIRHYEAIDWTSSGYPVKGEEGEQSTDAGWVKFGIKKSELGWRTLEFLAWACNDMVRAGERLRFFPTAPPPYLNAPGSCLSFVIECYPIDEDHDRRFKRVAAFIAWARVERWPQCKRDLQA